MTKGSTLPPFFSRYISLLAEPALVIRFPARVKEYIADGGKKLWENGRTVRQLNTMATDGEFVDAFFAIACELDKASDKTVRSEIIPALNNYIILMKQLDHWNNDNSLAIAAGHSEFAALIDRLSS